MRGRERVDRNERNDSMVWLNRDNRNSKGRKNTRESTRARERGTGCRKRKKRERERVNKREERNQPPPGGDSTDLDVERRRDGAQQSPGLPYPSPRCSTAALLPTPSRGELPPSPRHHPPHAASDPCARTFSRATDRSDVRPYIRTYIRP